MAKPLKILLVSDYAPPIGGAEIMTLMLRDGLRERGHDVRIFASRAESSPDDTHADYYCFGTTTTARTALQVANPWAYRRLRSVLAEFRPDVVHVKMFLTQLSPLILPLLRDVPTLHHVVWYRPSSKPRTPRPHVALGLQFCRFSKKKPAVFATCDRTINEAKNGAR